MNLIEIFSIIIIHFVADFWLQTEKQGLNKSKNWSDLLSHTYIYTITWLIPLVIIRLYGGYDLLNELFGSIIIMWFFPITFILHTITDYFTSRITSARYKSNHFYGINGFWFWISLDQFLHMVQLFGTYYLLVKI